GRKYPSLFIFSVNPTQGHSNLECEEVISAEIERLKTEPVTLRELEKARTRARAGVIHSLSSNMGMAFQLTFFEVLNGDWRNLFARLERYNRVTAEDIQRIVRDYFTIENRTLGVIETEETDS
ncbi:MAG: insulinase family protein, partial [bacterium]|nr:insulinase family protein [bacterium]